MIEFDTPKPIAMTNTALASGPNAGLVEFTEVPPHNPAFYRSRLP